MGSQDKSGKRPLEGVTVLDFTRVYSGPYCTMMLADLGAEVIKVERKGVGDDSRMFLPLPDNRGESGYFMYLNRNKKSIELDLKDKRAREIIYRLCKHMDVVVENFSPGVAARLGISYEDLKAHKPNIVYGSISGFGQSGPYRDKAAYDIVAQAMGGYMAVTGLKGGPPLKLGSSIADACAGIHMAYGLLAALYHKNQTGQGQHVDVAMMDTVFATMENFIVMQTFGKTTPTRNGNANLGSAPFNTFRTKDNYVAIAVANNNLFEKLSNAIGKKELLLDKRFMDNKGRKENEDTLNKIVEQWTSRLTTKEVCEILDSCKVPVGPILEIDELINDPHIAARNMLVEMNHPQEGIVKMPGCPIKFSDTKIQQFDASPMLGENTAEILEKYADYSAAEIEKLKHDGVIFQ